MKYLLPVLVAVIMVMPACRKKKTTIITADPVATARLSDVTSYSNGVLQATTHIVYNTDNTVDSMITTTYTSTNPSSIYRKYTYSTGYYEITRYYTIPAIPPAVLAKVYINSSGMITSVEHAEGYKTFTYDDKDQLSTYTDHQESPYIPATTHIYHYKWNNDGNIDSVNDSQQGDIYNPYYVNDMSRKGQTADVIRIQQFLGYGRTYLNTRSVPYAMYSGSFTDPIVPMYHYEYDAIGRITRSNMINDSTSYEEYSYY